MQIATKENSAVSMIKAALEKAKKYQKTHNIFVSLNKEGAMRRAQEIDEKIKKGENPGRLAGVPYALKDNFLSPEGATTASSKILEPLKSPITATAVEKLEKEGAIMIGRANMDSFAHGSSTENSYFGPTKNAKDETRVAGGSSGGSAVAVAKGIVEFATGTDTGGSIRQPASFNGVYGFKPTYGTISRYGVVAMASSTDCIGFFARSASDLDLLMSIASGQDPKDLTTLPNYYDADSERGNVAKSSTKTNTKFACSRACPTNGEDKSDEPRNDGREEASPNRQFRIGLIRDFDNDAVSADIRNALSAQVEKLKARGHEIVELDMPTLKYALAVYYIVVPAEIASNLSRHDGIRYGYRADSAKNLAEVFGNSRNEGFMPENKRRIMIGNFVLSSGFYDAYYLKAQKARTLIIEEYNKAFEKCDFILTPVAPNPAFKLGEKTGDPVAMYLEDVMSVPINLAGLPSLAFPAGEAETEEKMKIPLGLQLIGPRRSDKSLLEFARAELGKELD